MLHPQTFEFLKGLEDFNDKKFFDLYKPLYLKIKESFDNFIDEIIIEISKFDESLEGITAKQCVYRIYKDQRFPRNRETPYKTNLGGHITPNGKKFNKAGYYIHIENNKCMLCGGLAWPLYKDENIIRKAIYDNQKEFLKIINNKKFKELFGEIYTIREPLKRVQKEYENYDKKIEKYLRYKDRLAEIHFTNEEVLSPNFGKKIVEYCKILYPFVNFINESL